MAQPTPPQRPTEPTPARPSRVDGPLESLGKAISDPVREAADQTDEATKRARERAQSQADADDLEAEAPRSPVPGR